MSSSFFKDISNDFKVSFNELFDIVNYLHIPIRDLFEFSVYKTNSLMLIKKDGVYREKKKWSFGNQYIEKEYHDVYLRQNEYIHLWYNRVVMVFVEDKYSHIFSNCLRTSKFDILTTSKLLDCKYAVRMLSYSILDASQCCEPSNSTTSFALWQ